MGELGSPRDQGKVYIIILLYYYLAWGGTGVVGGWGSEIWHIWYLKHNIFDIWKMTFGRFDTVGYAENHVGYAQGISPMRKICRRRGK